MNAGLRRSWCTVLILAASVTGSAQSRIAPLRALDTAIRQVNQPESDYRKILGEAAATQAPGADDRMSAQIQRFLTRLPTPGTEFRCSEEFLRSRARDLLWRLRDVVLDVQTRPTEPVVCYATPFAVDLDRARTSGDVVDIYGFDFDATVLQLVVITPDGFRDVTSSLTVRSHTHATVRIGSDGVPASIATESIGLAWGHIIRYRVPLVGETTRLCSARVETIRAGRVISYSGIARRGIQSIPEATAVGADVRLDYSSNVLQAALCVTAADATASGCISEFLRTVDDARVIDAVVDPRSSEIAALPPGTLSVRRGLVDRWSSNGAGLVAARMNRIKLVSREAEGCLSPIAWAEARRTTTFSAATRNALDRQLRKVEPAIVGLRPRFAPP